MKPLTIEDLAMECLSLSVDVAIHSEVIRALIASSPNADSSRDAAQNAMNGFLEMTEADGDQALKVLVREKVSTMREILAVASDSQKLRRGPLLILVKSEDDRKKD